MEPAKRKWTRSPARQARYDKEREAIMKAAYRLVGRKDGPVSVLEILQSTDLSTRAFYRHFSSKDELVLTMYRTDNEKVAEALWRATEAEADPWSALEAWVDVALSVVFNPGAARHSRVLGSAEVTSSAGWAQEYLDGVGRMMESLKAVLGRGERDGTFRTVQLETDAQVIFGATSNLISLRQAGHPGITDRREATRIVMDAAGRLLGVDQVRRGLVRGKRANESRSAKRAVAAPSAAGYARRSGGGSGSTSRARAARAARA